jgi:hypothetical protein
MLHEIELRDMEWDFQVALMRQAMQYFIDEGKNPFTKGKHHDKT